MLAPLMAFLWSPLEAVALAWRACSLLALLAPAACIVPPCLALDILGRVYRCLCCEPRNSRCRRPRLALGLLGPQEDGSWLAWCCASILAPRLRRMDPVPTLLARWVAVCRPDLALADLTAHLMAFLRHQDQDLIGATGKAVVLAEMCSLGNVEAQLRRTFGAQWHVALLLDRVPLHADCLVESYRVVLREESLRALQALRRLPRAPRGALPLHLPRIWCCRRRGAGAHEDDVDVHRRRVTEDAEARSALLRVRRKGVAEIAALDLGLARIAVKVLRVLRLVGPGVSDALEDFAKFVEEQVDFTVEERLFLRARGEGADAAPALGGRSGESGPNLPRVLCRATPEVLIVSLEEGMCLAEVLKIGRAMGQRAGEEPGDAVARALAARRFALAFWHTILGSRRVALGGICPRTLLLRTGDDCNQTPDAAAGGMQPVEEVVVLRCHLAHEVSDFVRHDLLALAAVLADAKAERVGALALEMVQRPTSNTGIASPGNQDTDAFAAGVVELVRDAFKRRERGAALLQRVLGLCSKHDVHLSAAHLRLAAAVAAVHAVCARLDPDQAGNLCGALQVAARLCDDAQ